MAKKNERIGFRIPADVKEALTNIARREARSLAQICEALLRAGIEAYRARGSSFIRRYIGTGNDER